MKFDVDYTKLDGSPVLFPRTVPHLLLGKSVAGLLSAVTVVDCCVTILTIKFLTLLNVVYVTTS